MAEYVGALDQGTTSTRFIIFDRQGQIVALDQKEHEQIFPKPGWVEHNALEIWQNTQDVIRGALARSGISGSDLSAIGINESAETSVFVGSAIRENRSENAVVWQCTRTDGICNDLIIPGESMASGKKRAFPIATYFFGPQNQVDTGP